ncbi:MAG: RNA methyltransferase [Bacteroidia bacterium]
MNSVQELSKNQVKLIKSLGIKKYRYKHNLFVVEGKKLLAELTKSSFTIKQSFVTEIDTNINLPHCSLISNHSLRSVSQLTNPHFGLALVQIPKAQEFINEPINLVLDGIQDPGNLGTIIRLADWYGLNQITCTNNCVDAFSPKVVQASMGGIFRINLLETSVNKIKWLPNVYGAFMSGTDQNKVKHEFPCQIVIGNEGNGISESIENQCTQKITIKNYGNAESLNAAMATGIILDRFREKLNQQ